LDRGGGADNFRISPIARWARPPGDAIDFGATVTGSLLVTPPGARDPGDGASLAAPITNANESARGVAAVALASAARPVQVAIAACDAQPAIVPLPVQLEKSTPPLVPNAVADGSAAGRASDRNVPNGFTANGVMLDRN